MIARRYTLIALLFLCLAGCFNPSKSAGERTPPAGVETIENKGSDTIVNLALAWAEKYTQMHPEVSISVTGGGTGTGIVALINGTTDIANASREIKREELAAAQAKGIEPVEYVIARDAIAIIVCPDNPVQRLTIQQISDIYSGKINNWQEVGGEDLVIVRLSRETNSGTHVYFLEQVLRQGNSADKTLFSANTLLLPSSEGIIEEVKSNPHAIGYDGLGYVTPEVKILAVARTPADGYLLPSSETVMAGTYPIARDLYMYTTDQPGIALLAYLNWIFTPEAQAIVAELGFVPVVVESP